MRTLNAAEIAQLAHRAGFRGRDLEVAVAVALAESGGQPGVNAHGAEDSRGLWQINDVHFSRFDEGRLYQPLYNAKAAHRVWQESRSFRSDPWDAWSTYSNGTYRRFLSQARQAVRDQPRADGDGRGGGSRRGTESGRGPRGGGGPRPWRVPRNGPGRSGRVVYSPAFLQRLAARFTEYLAIAEQVDRRCRHVVAELEVDKLVLAGPFEGEIRRRAREAVDEWDGTRRLPRLLTRDVGFLVEHRRRVLGLDREEAFGRQAISALIKPLPASVFRDRSRQRLRRLLGQVVPGDPRPEQRKRLPTTPTSQGKLQLSDVNLTLAWGGTKSIFEQFVTPIMRRHDLEPGSRKRSYDTVDGSAMSDHYQGNKSAYAVDYPTYEGEAAARALARRMGYPGWRPNTYDSFQVTVDGQRFRVQILWGAKVKHGDHVHVGIRRA